MVASAMSDEEKNVSNHRGEVAEFFSHYLEGKVSRFDLPGIKEQIGKNLFCFCCKMPSGQIS
jgi:hypothetical protein